MTKYRCLDCSSVYDSEEAAVRCCHSPDQVYAYACTQCGKLFDEEEDAIKCCNWHVLRDCIEELEEEE